MDTRLKSITVLALMLLASLFASLLSASEARPLHSPLPGKDGIVREANGGFRALKSSGPSPGSGHKLRKLQNLGGMKDSVPPRGGAHRLKTLQDLGVINHSGPSPGEGHKYITNNHRLKTLQDLGVIKHSGPSPGEGHKYITNEHL